MNTIDTEGVQLKPGFWGRFASRRKTERDEAIKLLREAEYELFMFKEMRKDEGFTTIQVDQTLNKVQAFLKRFQ